MDAVSVTKPFVRKPVDFEKIQKQVMQVDLIERAPEGKYKIEDLVALDPNSEEQKNAAKRWFSPLYMSRNENLFQEYLQIERDSRQAISSYFDGNMSEEELGETFFNQVVDFLTAVDQNDYPSILGMTPGEEQAAVETFYSEFRYKILAEALKRNRTEGEQYIQGKPYAAQRSWAYYNSDYYYQSDKALSALKESVLRFAELQGYDNFVLPDYSQKGYALYNNFNSALFNPFCCDGTTSYFKDLEAEPPENFRFFFQTGASDPSAKKYAYLESVDGVPVDRPKADSAFDPFDPNKGTMWASYYDKDGNSHRIHQDITFDGTKNDLYKVINLMRFQNGSEDTLYNSFLSKFQIYPTGYYSRCSVGSLDARG